MKKSSIGMGLVAVGTLAICVYALIFIGRQIPAVEMGVHGWVALVLGTIVSLIVGGGLAAILVISRRRGFDDGAHDLYRSRFEEE